MDFDAFAAALRDGLEKERALRWDDAAALYADLVRKAPDPASRALALLRHGNALLQLRRWDDARTAFDAGLHEAKASGDADVVSQALLAALDGKTGRLDLAFVTFTKAQDVRGAAEDGAGGAAACEAQ